MEGPTSRLIGNSNTFISIYIQKYNRSTRTSELYFPPVYINAIKRKIDFLKFFLLRLRQKVYVVSGKHLKLKLNNTVSATSEYIQVTFNRYTDDGSF